MLRRAGKAFALPTSDRRRMAEAGFDHHLLKSVTLKAVEDLLAELKEGAVSRSSADCRPRRGSRPWVSGHELMPLGTAVTNSWN